MKKIKHFALGIVATALVTFGLYACSNDELQNPQQENTEQNSTLQGKPATTSDEGYSYAANFYSEDISLGESVDLIDSDTNDGITITEIIVNSDTRARGYIVNKLDTNEFLYFADVDREANEVTFYNKVTSELEVYDNLTDDAFYLENNKFDFLQIVNEQYAVMGGGFLERIWSKRTDCPDGAPATHHTLKIEREGYNDCYRTDCVEVRYRFGWRKEKSAGPKYMGVC